MANIAHDRTRTHDLTLRLARLSAAVARLVERSTPFAVTVFDAVPGMGTLATMRSLSDAMMLETRDLRIGCLADADLRHDGSGTLAELAEWVEASADRPALIILDEAGHAPRAVLRQIIGTINAAVQKTGGICAVAIVAHGDGDAVAAAVRDALGTIVGAKVETVSLR